MSKYRSLAMALTAALLISTLPARSHNAVAVVPLVADPPPLQNIITVSPRNADFTNPAAALDSISGADENNRYLVLIGPGIYTVGQTLALKEYVDVAGGGPHVTKLTGAISSGTADQTSALVEGADYSRLSGLEIENTGGGGYSIGVYNNGASPVLDDISVAASGGSSNNFGIYNFGASPKISNGAITVSGSAIINYGLFNFSSSEPKLSDVTITVSGASDANIGLDNSSSSPIVSEIDAQISGSANSNFGVRNANSSALSMAGSTITASGGSSGNVGLTNVDSSSTFRVRGSRITGATNSISANTGTGISESYVIDTVLDGPVSDSAICLFVFDELGTELDANCGDP